MKTITIYEYTYLMHKYDGTISITDEEFIQLHNQDIDADYLASKYSINYSGSYELIDHLYEKDGYDIE